MKKFLLIILDGAADKKSVFAKAKKPYLDMLASNSVCGLWKGPHAPHYNPRSMSSIATLEILGYNYKDEPGRGYLEALSLGIKIKKNSVYARGNFAYVSGERIIDRRAGRDETGLNVLTNALNKKIRSINGVKIKLYRVLGHRALVVLTGSDLSKNVSDNDVGKKTEKIKPLDRKAKKTAEILNEFTRKSSEILSRHPINKKRKIPANFLLLRSAGSYQKVENFKKRYNMRACSISGVNIIRGISRYLGIDIIPVPLSQLEDDLHLRVSKAIDALERYDFVILHINGADTYAHNKDFRGKANYIEKIDREVFSQLIRLRAINIAVVCDHITDSKSGEHVFGPVPFLIYCCEEEEYEQKGFDEKTCKKGFVTDNPMKKILSV